MSANNKDIKIVDITAESIVIRVCGQLGETHFKVNMSTEMRQVFDSYADRMGIQASSVGFLLGYSEIGPEQTVRELALKDDDTINCFTKHLPDSTGANIVVHIKNLMGDTVDFEINLFDQIQMLVYKITEHEGIPEDQQRLIFAGTQLELDRNAAMYGIQNGSTIHLVLKLRGT